jgi:hypothetical protein
VARPIGDYLRHRRIRTPQPPRQRPGSLSRLYRKRTEPDDLHAAARQTANGLKTSRAGARFAQSPEQESRSVTIAGYSHLRDIGW